MSPEASGKRAIAAGRIGTAITGDISAVMLPPEILHAARDIQAPLGLSNLPPRPLCLGREDELAWLHSALTADRETAITQTPTVHGLGGIGKSTVALAYAHHHRTDYPAVWWINADSVAAIERSLATLTSRLLPVWGDHATEQERAAWATTWLQWHPGWLLIFDNVENPGHLTPYTGALTGGHVIITSRRAFGWPATTPTRALGLLDPVEATQLLCERALDHTPTPAEREAARALAADLGHLPLALEQAGAYLRQNRTITIDRYRQRLNSRLGKTVAGTDPERTITRIWAQTLETLETTNPDSVRLLAIMAWLAPDNIPIELLPAPGGDPDALDEALGDLHAYSMVTLTSDTAGIHRLVQTVLRNTPTAQPGKVPPGRREAEHALTQALTDIHDDDPTWDTLTPHLIALAATPTLGHVDDALLSRYLTAAERLQQRGHGVRAIPLHEAVVAQCEQTLGETHPNTLASRGNLARTYQAAGDLRRAIPLLEVTLTQCEQTFGDIHPNTLASRNNLALAYKDAGDLRAIPTYEAVVAQCEQVLGDTHPDTLASRGNLAGAYRAAGDLQRAIPLLETTLTQREHTLGDTHPNTLTNRSNLALAYQAVGDLQRAIPLLETTLTQREHTLGDTHPNTLTSRNNLANAYQAAGDLQRAIPLLETTLTQCEQALGDTHPETLASRNNLASAYQAAGDLQRAIPLLETTLTQCERAFGDTHPDTLICRNNLAMAYQAAGDLQRAIPLLETTLTQREHTLGDTHPDTLVSRGNLAMAYRAAGDLQRAIPLLETVLTQRGQAPGGDAPQNGGSSANPDWRTGWAGNPEV